MIECQPEKAAIYSAAWSEKLGCAEVNICVFSANALSVLEVLSFSCIGLRWILKLFNLMKYAADNKIVQYKVASGRNFRELVRHARVWNRVQEWNWSIRLDISPNARLWICWIDTVRWSTYDSIVKHQQATDWQAHVKSSRTAAARCELKCLCLHVRLIYPKSKRLPHGSSWVSP